MNAKLILFLLALGIFFSDLNIFKAPSLMADLAPARLPRSDYRSKSGRYILFVAPNDSSERKQTKCRLLKDGEEVWQRNFLFQLLYARVLDDGTICGFGYTLGLVGVKGNYGDLVITVIAPDGKIRVREAYRRRMGIIIIMPQVAFPVGGNIIVDSENDMVIFLVAYDFNDRDDTAWRQFQLSTGKPLGVFYPQKQMRNTKKLCRSPHIRPLPGTPLLLVQWGCLDQKDVHSLDNIPEYGVTFALLDRRCKPVWEKALPGDYARWQDKEGARRLEEWVIKNSAILSVESPGLFDLYFAKKRQRVTFSAKQNENGKWEVHEIGRKQYTPPDLAVSRKANSGQATPP